jgi:ABC-type uncharacterized transport system permease subunit
VKDLIRDLGINIGLLLAGFAGSLVMVKQDGHKDWWTTGTSLVAGTLSANYLTPLAVDALGIKGSNTQYACAFVLGFLGLHGVEFILSKVGISKKNDK